MDATHYATATHNATAHNATATYNATATHYAATHYATATHYTTARQNVTGKRNTITMQNTQTSNNKTVKRYTAKGFTIVELSIVIAVIAILIAVIVPSFITIMDKAKRSNDNTLVTEANTIVTIEETLEDGSCSNVTEAISAVVANGYSVDKLEATADGCTLAYDTESGSFIILDDYATEEDVATENICIINPDDTTLAEAYTAGITNFCYYNNSDSTVTIDTSALSTTEGNTVTIWLYTENTEEETTVNVTGSNTTVKVCGSATTINVTDADIEFCSSSVTGTVYLDKTDNSQQSAAKIALSAAKLTEKNVNSTDGITVTYVEGAKLGTIIRGDVTVALVVKESDNEDSKAEMTEGIANYLYVNYGVSFRSTDGEAKITLNYNYGDTENGSATTTKSDDTWSSSSINDPTRTGYTFKKWYLDEDCTIAYDNTKITSDITLYAGWEIIVYTVNFYNGNEIFKTVNVNYGECIDEFDNPTTTANGVYWGGWNTSSDGTGNTFTLGSSYANNFATGNATIVNLYAYWAKEKYTLTFDANGGYFSDNATTTTVEAYYGDTVISVTNPTRSYKYTYNGNTYDIGDSSSAYEFKGWYTDIDCTNEFTFSETKVTSDLTLYAKWDGDKEVVNGVIYTRVSLGSDTSKKFGTDNKITVNDLSGYYYVVTGYISDIFTDLGYYKDGSWLVLENTIYGYPVLEIGAGALGIGNDAYSNTDSNGDTVTLKNVLVPENIVMVGSRAFLDNKGIESIVFLADTVYFSSYVSESTSAAYSDDSVISYGSNKTSGIKADSDANSKNYPFYGCTTSSSNYSSLTVYYKTAYSTLPNTTDTTNGSYLNSGVFVVKRDGTSVSGYTYYRSLNLKTTAQSSSLSDNNWNTISWLYINTKSITQTLTCGEDERGDFDWAGALTDALTSYGAAYYCNSDGYVFIACGLGEIDTEESLYNHIVSYLKNAIDGFTAEYGEYIHGYNITATTDNQTNGNDITITATADSDGKYYLVNLSYYLTTTDTSEWKLEYVTSDNTVAITYTAEVNSTDITVTVKFTGSDVEYYNYSARTTSTTTDGSGLFAKGDITISGSSDYNYYLSKVGDTTLDTPSATGATTTAKTVNINAVTDINLTWTQTNDNYIYIVSEVAFTYSDGKNTTEIKKNTDSGTPLLASHVAQITSGNNLPTASDNIYGYASGNYFLGWATYMYEGKIVDATATGATLTFTNITVNEGTFDNSTTYYAIWGYWEFATDENCTTALSCTVTTSGTSFTSTTPTLDGTFFGWYADEEFSGTANTLANGKYTYYAKAAATTVTVNGVKYTFINTSTATAPDSTTYSATEVTFGNSNGDCYIKVSVDGGYYRITGYDSSTLNTNGYQTGIYSSETGGSWLILKNTINEFKVLEIGAGALKGALLKNVIVPENIVMINYRAFLDNYGIENIVFLAEEVLTTNRASYNGSTTVDRYNDVEHSSDEYKDYPFYGCTISQNSSDTYLTIHYNKIANVWAAKWNDSTNDTCHELIFNLRNNGDKYATKNTSWLYINTSVSSLISRLESVDIEGYADTDIQSDIIDALKNFATAGSYTYDAFDNGYIFIAADLSSTATIDSTSYTLAGYIKYYVENKIDAYTAGCASYINGHSVLAAADSDSHDITVTVTNKVVADNEVTETDNTPYYLVSITGSTLSGTESTAIDDYTLSYATSEEFDGNVYVPAGTQTVTITETSGKYTLSSLTYNGTEYTNIAFDNATVYTVSVDFGTQAGEIALVWATATDPTITIYSEVAATYGTNSTTLGDGTDNKYTLTKTDALSSATTDTDGVYYLNTLTASVSNYYFLGWAVENENTLTFTTVKLTEAFAEGNYTTYYAIWGTSAIGVISTVALHTSGSNISDPTMSSGTFYSWYTDYKTSTYNNTFEFKDNKSYSGLSNGYKDLTWSTTFSDLSYSVFDGKTSTLESGKYVYYARMQYSFVVTLSGGTNGGLWMDTNNVNIDNGKSSYTYTYCDTSGSIKNNTANDNPILEGNFVFVYYENTRHYSNSNNAKRNSCANINIYENFEYFLNENSSENGYTINYDNTTSLYSSNYVTYHSFNMWYDGGDRWLYVSEATGTWIAKGTESSSSSKIGSSASTSTATALTDYTMYTIVQDAITLKLGY